ncbi:MAG: hypothetical protein AAGL69_08945 [Pseudomonadota bacterium]
MEITMQWWDDADDIYYAALLRLQATSHWTPILARLGLATVAFLTLV